MGHHHYTISVLREATGALVLAAVFALLCVLVGLWLLFAGIGALVIVYGILWWFTERSQSKFGKEHRAWREERAMIPIRDETEKVREEAAEEARHTRALMWFQGGGVR